MRSVVGYAARSLRAFVLIQESTASKASVGLLLRSRGRIPVGRLTPTGTAERPWAAVKEVFSNHLSPLGSAACVKFEDRRLAIVYKQTKAASRQTRLLLTGIDGALQR